MPAVELSDATAQALAATRTALALGSDDACVTYLLSLFPAAPTRPLLRVLATELFRTVFHHLDSVSIHSAALVCRTWRNEIQRDVLLRPLCKGELAGLYVVGGIRPDETRLHTLREVGYFSPVYKRWVAMPPMLHERYHCAAVVLGRQLYVLGGRNADTRLDSVERFDPVAGVWKPMPSLSTVRSAPAVVAFHGCLYVFGGFDGKVEYRTIEKFDPEANQWYSDSGSWMPIEACEVSAVVVRDAIYLIGGTQSRYSQQENVLAVCQRYSPGTNTWTVMAPMANKRMCPAAAVLGGKIYVIGGSDGLNSLDVVEVYCPDTDTWSNAPPMNENRSNATACVFDGEIYVAGGFCSGALDTVEKYNPVTNRWHYVTRMPEKRDACKIVCIE